MKRHSLLNYLLLIAIAFLSLRPDAYAGPTGVTKIANISTRAVVGRNTDILAAGFTVAGSGPKKVIIRGIGPTLESFGISGILQHPHLELFNSNGLSIATNTEWGDGGTSVALQLANSMSAAGLFPLDPLSHDCVLISTLQPGNYTVHVSGLNGTTGIALIEVYENDETQTRFSSLSCRGFVGSGSELLVSGITIKGARAKQILFRAVGSGLSAFGIADALKKPVLTLFDSSGTPIATNSGWNSVSATTTQEITRAMSGVGLFPLASSGEDAALLSTIEPGNYTVQVSGSSDTSGIALVEVYEIPDEILTAPPRIISQPVNPNVGVGDPAFFDVTAIGGQLTYQWSRNDIPISGATDSAYTTPPLSLSESGTTYQVAVANSLGIQTSQVVRPAVLAMPDKIGPTQSASAATQMPSLTVGALSLPGIAAVTIPKNALQSGTNVNITAQVGSEFDGQLRDASQIYGLNHIASNVVRLNIGQRLPSSDGISLTLSIPDSLSKADALVGQLAIFLLEFSDDSTGFEPIIDGIPMTQKSVTLNIPREYFTSAYSGDGSFECIFLLGAKEVPTTKTSSASNSKEGLNILATETSDNPADKMPDPSPSTPFSAPIAGKLLVKSVFGHRVVLAKDGYRPPSDPHPAVDIHCAEGTEVRAVAAGIVNSIIDKKSGNDAKIIIIDHDDGRLSTKYVHLSRILAFKNKRVQAGEIIGISGRTGTPIAHLHFGVTLYKGIAVDPMPYIYHLNYGIDYGEAMKAPDPKALEAMHLSAEDEGRLPPRSSIDFAVNSQVSTNSITKFGDIWVSDGQFYRNYPNGGRFYADIEAGIKVYPVGLNSGRSTMSMSAAAGATITWSVVDPSNYINVVADPTSNSVMITFNRTIYSTDAFVRAVETKSGKSGTFRVPRTNGPDTPFSFIRLPKTRQRSGWSFALSETPKSLMGTQPTLISDDLAHALP